MKGLKMLNQVDKFQEVLKLRTFFKLVSQVSWDISQLERRYPLESCTDEELVSLSKAYREYLKMLTTQIGDYKE